MSTPAPQQFMSRQEEDDNDCTVQSNHFEAIDDACDKSFKALYNVLYNGGNRNLAVGPRVNEFDIVPIIEYLKDHCDEDDIMAILKLCLSYLQSISDPVCDPNYAMYEEERACVAFFKASARQVKNNNVYQAANVDLNDVLTNFDLITTAYNTIKDNIICIDRVIDACQLLWSRHVMLDNDNDYQDTVTSFLSMEINPNLTKAGNQTEFHREQLNGAVASCQLQTTNDVPFEKHRHFTQYLLVDKSGQNGQDKNDVLRCAKEITKFMIDNNLKRYTKTKWTPPHDTTSAASVQRTIHENLGVEGIYQQIEICKEPVKVIFDSERNEVVGYLDSYFDRDECQINDLPPELDVAQLKIGLLCTGHFYPDKGSATYSAGEGMCCDLMHCKNKDGDAKWRCNNNHHNNIDNIDLSTHHADSSKKAHCFRPHFKERKNRVMTRGYRKYSTLDDFIDWYFSLENCAEAVVRHLTSPSLLARIKDYFSKSTLPKLLTLVPYDHVYLFADGYLVCESNLVQIPEFFPFNAPELQAGGKFSELDTLSVYPSEVFREDEYLYNTLKVQKQNTVVVEGKQHTVCSICGCSSTLCSTWQEEFFNKRQQKFVTFNELSEWFQEDEMTENDLCEIIESYIDQIQDTKLLFISLDGRVNRSFKLYKHEPDFFKPLKRSDGEKICNLMDLGVLDDILIFQYDWPEPWRDLPAHLRVDDEHGRFWRDEIIKIRNEAIFQWGRLYYRKGEYLNLSGNKDKTQNMLGTIGIGNTGKSTALNLIKRGMNITQISVLDCSTFEQQFGLSQIIDSAFVAINEVETDSKTLSAGLIKQLCDDSLMSAPRKNKDVKFSQMSAHIWFLGNEKLFSSDPSGALGRRIGQMHWLREVDRQHIDPQLEVKFNLHFGHTLATLHLKYWDMMERHSTHDFWYRNGPQYPFMSWIWHHLRREGELTSSKLTQVIEHFLSQAHSWKFSSKEDVRQFTKPDVTIHASGSITLDDAIGSNKDWFEDIYNARKQILPICYMPLNDQPEASGHKCSGLKLRHQIQLKELNPGGRSKDEDFAWGKRYDFYGRSFDQAGLILVERVALPWPPWSNECIKADWIIGMAPKDMFADEGGEMWDNIVMRSIA